MWCSCGLDAARVERRQPRRVAIDVAVRDQVDLRVRRVEPLGALVGGHDVDRAHPRREQVERAQRVLQLVAIPEPLVVGTRVARGCPSGLNRCPLFEPRWVLAVDPGVDDVDGEVGLIGRREVAVEVVLGRAPIRCFKRRRQPPDDRQLAVALEERRRVRIGSGCPHRDLDPRALHVGRRLPTRRSTTRSSNDLASLARRSAARSLSGS